MKANVWRVTGYRGKSDYDGPADDNTKLDILFDGRLKKEDVEDILFYYWGKKYRSVAIKAELLEEPKIGEWKFNEPDSYGNKKPYCSNCGEYHLSSWSDYTSCIYCPNCGAKMKKET